MCNKAYELHHGVYVVEINKCHFFNVKLMQSSGALGFHSSRFNKSQMKCSRTNNGFCTWHKVSKLPDRLLKKTIFKIKENTTNLETIPVTDTFDC